MKYRVRKATQRDIDRLRAVSTENGNIDEDAIRRSEEIRCFLCDDEPLMILGLVDHPTGDDRKVVALWGMFNKNIQKHTKTLVKTCMGLIFERVGYTFVCYIDESNKKFKRFATFFGFQPSKNVEEFEGKLYRFYVKRN